MCVFSVFHTAAQVPDETVKDRFEVETEAWPDSGARMMKIVPL